MGFGDIVSKILLEVRADTSDAKAKLRDLSAEERKIERARIDGMEASNKGLEKWVKGMGTVGLALGAVKVAFEAVEQYGHKLDLQAAAAGVSIAGLSKASMGLKSNMELLEHAARFNKSAFKLTQEQMETTERAMYALEERGNKSADVWSAVDAALTKGAIKPLEQFGIVIDKTGLQLDENGLKMDTYGQKQEAVRRIMEALGGTAREAEGAQHDAADAMQVEIVKLQNFWDQAKDALAQLVISLTPLLQGLAEAVKYASELVDKLPKGALGLGGGGAVQGSGDVVITNDLIAKLAGARGDSYFKGDNEQLFAGYKPYANLLNVIAQKLDYQNKNLIEFETDVTKNVRAGKPEYRYGQFASVNSFDRLGGGIGTGSVGGLADTKRYNEYGVEQTDQALLEGIENARTADLTKDWQKRLGEQQAKKTSFLESTFGKVDEFDKYAAAFQMLTGAVSAGLNAWIDGSMSAGQAIKKFLADALKGLASQMAVEALKHGAYALGSLAFGDVRGAATHAAAAAAFGGAAAAAAVAAKQLGGGGATAAASGGGSGAGAGSGASGGGASFGGNEAKRSGERIIVVMGDSHSRSSPRMAQLEAERVVNLAFGGTGVTGR